MPDVKTDLLSLPPEDLETVLAKHFETRGQPSYRADQVKKWVFEECVPSIAGMTNLPVAEREALEAEFSLVEPLPMPYPGPRTGPSSTSGGSSTENSWNPC